MTMFINEYEIEDLLVRFSDGETPNLLAGITALRRLCRWTNSNSDGWAYWPKPTRAAAKLMELLQSADRFDPQDCTEAKLRSTLTPIKAFLTKQGVDHEVVFPTGPIQTYRVEVRFDVTGTESEARATADTVANAVGGEITAIFDEQFDELD